MEPHPGQAPAAPQEAFFSPYEAPPAFAPTPEDAALAERVATAVRYAAKSGPPFIRLMMDKNQGNPQVRLPPSSSLGRVGVGRGGGGVRDGGGGRAFVAHDGIHGGHAWRMGGRAAACTCHSTRITPAEPPPSSSSC
jgi:hypothetical protein